MRAGLAPSNPTFLCENCENQLHKAPFATTDGRRVYNRLYEDYTVRPYFFECGNFSMAVPELDGTLVRTDSGAVSRGLGRRDRPLDPATAAELQQARGRARQLGRGRGRGAAALPAPGQRGGGGAAAAAAAAARR